MRFSPQLGSGPEFRNATLGDDGGRLCQSSLDTVKVRGALGERGDGDWVAALTPFNLCWQFQFPAEKDISHLCLKNPNHTVLLINLSVVTLVLCSRSDSSTRLGSSCQQLLLYLLLFTVIIKTPLDAGFSVVFTNHLIIFLLLRGGGMSNIIKVIPFLWFSGFTF